MPTSIRLFSVYCVDLMFCLCLMLFCVKWLCVFVCFFIVQTCEDKYPFGDNKHFYYCYYDYDIQFVWMLGGTYRRRTPARET